MPNLESLFPNLTGSNYTLTSPPTRQYNCIAFAAGATDRWWWPSDYAYWPSNVPRDETIATFIQAFQTLGYLQCDHGEFESGFEKVVIYTDAFDVPTHMARQLPSGNWTSKCGSLEDIEHVTLEALESSTGYGYSDVFS